MKNVKKYIELLKKKIGLLEDFIWVANDINERHGYRADDDEIKELEDISSELNKVQKHLDEFPEK